MLTIRVNGGIFTFLASDAAEGKFNGSLFRPSETVPVYPIGAFEIMGAGAVRAKLQFLHFGSEANRLDRIRSCQLDRWPLYRGLDFS